MTRTEIEEEYFDWMCGILLKNRPRDIHSFRKLLTHLHEIEFRYILPKDGNRAADGAELRYRFAYDNYEREYRDTILDYLARPCSVLEMMVALSFRCEEIMDDPGIGDRTAQWFWNMIVTLGLGGMYDYNYDKQLVDEKINKFLDRKFDPDGKGSLFRIRNCEYDVRKFEIWIAMLWYLDTIA